MGAIDALKDPVFQSQLPLHFAILSVLVAGAAISEEVYARVALEEAERTRARCDQVNKEKHGKKTAGRKKAKKAAHALLDEPVDCLQVRTSRKLLRQRLQAFCRQQRATSAAYDQRFLGASNTSPNLESDLQEALI